LIGVLRCIWGFIIPSWHPTLIHLKNENHIRLLYGQRSLREKKAELYELHYERCLHIAHTHPHGIIGQLSAVFSHFVRKDYLLKLRYSGIPISLMVGTEDILVNVKNSHSLQRTFECPLIIFDGCGHNLNTEEVHKMNDCLLGHIEKVESTFEYKNILDREIAIKDFIEKRQNPRALRLLGLLCSHRPECTTYILQTLIKGIVTGMLFRIIVRILVHIYRSYKAQKSIDVAYLFNRNVIPKLFSASLLSSYARALWTSIWCIRHGYRAWKESRALENESDLPSNHHPRFPYGPIVMSTAFTILLLNNLRESKLIKLLQGSKE